MSEEVQAWDRALRAILARHDNEHAAMRDIVDEAMADGTGTHMLVHCLATLALQGMKRQFGDGWHDQVAFERLRLQLADDGGLVAET